VKLAPNSQYSTGKEHTTKNAGGIDERKRKEERDLDWETCWSSRKLGREALVEGVLVFRKVLAVVFLRSLTSLSESMKEGSRDQAGMSHSEYYSEYSSLELNLD
jgi:hypothetical protein